ncbi:hypothetical protein EJB05_14040, partial [Eragrostis curvula]
MATAEMLTDKILEEVLFRIPPDDPMTLISAALVSKHWRRVVSDPGFRCRFHDFHGAPPMLGVLCNSMYAMATYKSRFIPTCSFRSPHAIATEFRVVDARYGHVLLRTSDFRCSFAVWDPVKDEITCELPEPPFACIEHPIHGVAAVLCAAGDCDHLHCQRGPFRVVYVTEEIFACVYSSEDGVWRELSSSPRGYIDTDTVSLPSELLGNALHFVCEKLGTDKILRYDLATRDASVIPTPTSSYGYPSTGVLMTTEEGGLGFATVEECTVFLWSLQQATLGEEADVDQWALTRVIELPTALPAQLVGFASGVRVLFYTTSRGIHAVNLNTIGARKIRIRLQERTRTAAAANSLCRLEGGRPALCRVRGSSIATAKTALGAACQLCQPLCASHAVMPVQIRPLPCTSHARAALLRPPSRLSRRPATPTPAAAPVQIRPPPCTSRGSPVPRSSTR